MRQSPGAIRQTVCVTRSATQTPEHTPEGPVPFHLPLPLADENVPVPTAWRFGNITRRTATTVPSCRMRTIVPLRVIGIISMVFFIAYGALAGAITTFLLYLLSLPINVIRLRQMLTLVKKARLSAQGDLSMDWLRPFMTPRKCKKGEILFKKGDLAKEMFYTVSGNFLIKEIGIELPPGRVLGELGFIDPNNKRTATVESLENGEVLTITYDRLLELYFQNPEFGYYFLRLTTERLMQNIARLEATNAENRAKLLELQATPKSSAG